MGHVGIDFRRSNRARNELHEQIPGERIKPGYAIHADAIEDKQADDDSADVSQRRREAGAARKPYVPKPNS